MNKNNKHFIIGSTLFIVLLFFLFFLLYRVPVIQVSYPDHSFYLKNKSFEIGWIHSVEKEVWYENYIIKDRQLYLDTTRFKTFGAGVPSDGEIIPSNDGFIHMRINRKMEAVHLVVSDNVRTTLYTENLIIPLYEQVKNHEEINIKVVNLPLWTLRGDIYE